MGTGNCSDDFKRDAVAPITERWELPCAVDPRHRQTLTGRRETPLSRAGSETVRPRGDTWSAVGNGPERLRRAIRTRAVATLPRFGRAAKAMFRSGPRVEAIPARGLGACPAISQAFIPGFAAVFWGEGIDPAHGRPRRSDPCYTRIQFDPTGDLHHVADPPPPHPCRSPCPGLALVWCAGGRRGGGSSRLAAGARRPGRWPDRPGGAGAGPRALPAKTGRGRGRQSLLPGHGCDPPERGAGRGADGPGSMSSARRTKRSRRCRRAMATGESWSGRTSPTAGNAPSISATPKGRSSPPAGPT